MEMTGSASEFSMKQIPYSEEDLMKAMTDEGYRNNFFPFIKNCTCKVWGTEAVSLMPTPRSNTQIIFSPRTCGFYLTTLIGYDGVFHMENGREINNKEKAIITTWLINQRKSGCVPLLGSLISSCSKLLEILKISPIEIDKKLDNIMNHLAENELGKGTFYDIKSTRSISSKIPDLNKNRYLTLKHRFSLWKLLAVSESGDFDELNLLVDNLLHNHYVKFSEIVNANLGIFDGAFLAEQYLILTVNGLNEAKKSVTQKSNQVFIAMWFDDRMSKVGDAIEEGIEDAGYKPFRVDGKEHNNKIDDEIIAEINRSRFVVADCTHGNDGARGSVYYEAGYAHGLGLEVIFTCDEKVIDEIHFDTRQYNHITWKEIDKKENKDIFIKEIKNRILATIGEGSYKGEKKTDEE